LQVCTKCGVEKPLTEYYERVWGINRQIKTRHRQCKVCIGKQVQRSNARRATERREYLKRKYQERSQGKVRRRKGDTPKRVIRRAFLNWIKESPCADCGNCFDPVSMDFDHIRGEKLFNLPEVVGMFIDDEIVMEEIQKCEVVCSNCHRVRTKKRKHERKQQRSVVSSA
jgi:hypothetical protein